MKKYITNTVWMMSDHIVGKGLAIVVVAIIARYLGPEDYGMYAYAMSMAVLFGIIGHMGLDALVVLELVRKPDAEAETLGTTFVLKGGGYVLGAIALLIFGMLMPDHRPTERWLFAIASIGVLAQPFNSVLGNWFRARVEARYAVISNLTAIFTASALKVVLVIVGAGVLAIGLAHTVGIAVGAVVMGVLFVRRGGPKPKVWSFSRERARALLSDSWMLFVGTLFAIIYSKIDIVMLRSAWGPETVGLYSVATLVSEASYFLPIAIVATIFPRLIEIHETDRTAFEKQLQDLFYFLSFLAVAAMIGLFVVGPLLIGFAVGPSYSASIPILFIHILGLPFIFLQQAYIRWILIKKLAKFVMISQGSGAALNIVLNLILIPKYGGLGAAVATVISYAVAAYFVVLISPQTRPMFGVMTRSILQPWRGAMQAIDILKIARKRAKT